MKRQAKDQELLRLAEAELDGEKAGPAEPLEPEELLPSGQVEVGGRLYPEPTCYACVLMERIATGRLPYELTATERGLYLLWVVLHQQNPAELAALTQRPLAEAELARFAAEHGAGELFCFLEGYLPSAVGRVKKKSPPEAGGLGLVERLLLVARFAGTSVEEVLFRWPARRATAFCRLMTNLHRAGEEFWWRNTPPRSGLETRL